MRILVCVKRVPITGGRMVLTSDAQALETKHLGFTISPHEECGVEEAVRIVEAGGGEVVVLTLGPPEAEEQLRDCMAIGADRGILLQTNEEWDAQATATAIVDAVRAEEPFDLLLFGNESADAGNYQVGIRVAYALCLPVVTGLKKIELSDGRARVARDAGGARDGAKSKPVAMFEPAGPASKLEKQRLIVAEGQGKQAEILGHGAEAAPKVVEVMQQLGVA